jgi:hypothetical protein
MPRTKPKKAIILTAPAVSHWEVVDYALFLAPHMTVEEDAAHFYAYIVCQGKSGQTLTFYFMRPDSPGGANSYNPATGQAVAYLPADQYLWYVDMLRNEKPVFAYVNKDNPGWNRIHTGQEPVGEGELAMQR